MNIQIISGSARTTSATKRVALHLQELLAGNEALEVGLIDMQDHHLLPVEEVWATPEMVPRNLQAVANQVYNADAFILVTPEYNGSYSPAMKNFLDHFPKQDRKVFGIVAASTGSLGGIRAALQLQTMVAGLFGISSPRMLIVPEVQKKFAHDGALLDESFVQNVESFISEVLWLSGAVTRAKEIGVTAPRQSSNTPERISSVPREVMRIYRKALLLLLGVALAVVVSFTHSLTNYSAVGAGQQALEKMIPTLLKHEFDKVETQGDSQQTKY